MNALPESRKRSRPEEEEELEEGEITTITTTTKTTTITTYDKETSPPPTKKQKKEKPTFSFKEKPDWLKEFEENVLYESEAFYQQDFGVDLRRIAESNGSNVSPSLNPFEEDVRRTLLLAAQQEEDEDEDRRYRYENVDPLVWDRYEDFSYDVRGSFDDLRTTLNGCSKTSYVVGDRTYEEMVDLEKVALDASFFYNDAFETLEKHMMMMMMMSSSEHDPCIGVTMTPIICRHWLLLRRSIFVVSEMYEYAKAAQDMVEELEEEEEEEEDSEEDV